MTDLTKISDSELQAELDRRRSDPNIGMPTPLENPDYSKLHKMIVDELETTNENKSEDEDFSNYVYEAAMEAVFGPRAYWDWVNELD